MCARAGGGGVSGYLCRGSVGVRVCVRVDAREGAQFFVYLVCVVCHMELGRLRRVMGRETRRLRRQKREKYSPLVVRVSGWVRARYKTVARDFSRTAGVRNGR